MEKSANWVFYDARNPDDLEFGHNTYHPDCQLRAWSKALDLDYRRLAIWLNLPDPDRTLNGKYVPYFRTSDRTDSVDKRKMDKYIAMNNLLRTTAEFPGLYSWGISFGRYVKSWKCRGYVGHEFDEELEDLDMWCEEHQNGTYVVVVDCSSKRMGKDVLHAVAVVDGKFYDTWDSGYGIVIGWFEINTNKIMLDKKPKNASKKGNFFRKIKENREMKKRYTKRQITEAIAYWKKQLNESPVSDDEFNKCRETAEDIVANTVVSEAEQKQAILPFVAAEALIQYANFISRFAVKDKNSAEKRLAMNGAVKDFKRYALNVLDIAYDLGFTSRGDVVEIRESDEENYDEG